MLYVRVEYRFAVLYTILPFIILFTKRQHIIYSRIECIYYNIYPHCRVWNDAEKTLRLDRSLVSLFQFVVYVVKTILRYYTIAFYIACILHYTYIYTT